jgi:intracellular multiplication protein IcmB
VPIVDAILDTFDGLLIWLGNSLGQFSESYCELETADDLNTLVGKDGSLVSVIKIEGATFLVGPEEFERMHQALTQTLQSFIA